ncbi:MAG TPA: alcohol dehydrogenase catalytic domain-containing protein [Thermoanaerobaculia bacterium]|jgi:L-iditol 2-dehydrogenase
MKAYVQTALDRFEERELPRPRPAPGEAVLRVRLALTCGTDLKLLRRGHARIAYPVTMGHEVCGDVVEVGEGVSRDLIGARVVPAVTGPCGICPDCRRGFANLCPVGHADRTWGAFADFVRVPAGVVAASLHRPPASLSDEAAAFLDPLASVLHGWSRLGLPSPERLLIYGSGGLALLWAATARARGVPAIVAGRRPERLSLAAGCGAEALDLGRHEPEDLFSRTGTLPAAAVDCTGDPGVWMRLPNLVRHGGTVLFFGGCAPGATVSFDAARLHYSEMALIGSFHYTPDEARAAMAMLAAREVDPRPLVTEIGKLSDLPRFLESQARGDGVRYAVRPVGDAA